MIILIHTQKINFQMHKHTLYSHVEFLMDTVQDSNLNQGQREREREWLNKSHLSNTPSPLSYLFLHVSLLVLQCVVEGVELPCLCQCCIY